MTKINTSEDCGNSPKNILIQDLMIAFAKGATQFILKSVADEIEWNIVGGPRIQGKANFSRHLKEMTNHKTAELNIFHVSTHGRTGAVNGTKKLKNGQTFAFCDVYEFTNAKGTSIRDITSYMIEISS